MEFHTDLYEIKHIKGHGSGLVARRDISRGTRILAEAPIMQIYMKSPSSIVEQVQTHFDRLAQDDKRSCESLHCVDFECVVPQAEKEVLTFRHFASEKERETVYRLMAVFYTNQFSLDFLSPHTSGLFAKISRINHSCIPNTQWSYNQKLGRLTIHANRDITAGTEITITYKPTDTQTYEQRKRDLLVYGFECDCEACNDRETSDGRRARMADLDDKIAKYMDGAPTNDEYRCALEMVEEFVDLYSKEQLAGREFEARSVKSGSDTLFLISST